MWSRCGLAPCQDDASPGNRHCGGSRARIRAGVPADPGSWLDSASGSRPAPSGRSILRDAGIEPAPRRLESSWKEFLRRQAATIIECDFLTVDTVFFKRFYVLFLIELASRRVHITGITANPDGAWVTQQVRNLVMCLEGEGVRMRFLIRYRDSKFTASFDEVFRSEGIRVIRAPVRAPRAERTPSAGSEACAASVSTE